MDNKIIEVTNAIRVKIKERQLDILTNFVNGTDRENLNTRDKQIYDASVKMIELLPEDIERFRNLSKLDELISSNSDTAPEIIRLNSSKESLNDITYKYTLAYYAEPNRALSKELAEMYQDLLLEQQNSTC